MVEWVKYSPLSKPPHVFLFSKQRRRPELELGLSALQSSLDCWLVEGWTSWRCPQQLLDSPKLQTSSQKMTLLKWLLKDHQDLFLSKRNSPSVLTYSGLLLPTPCKLFFPRNSCRRATTLWVIKPTRGVHSCWWIHLGCHAVLDWTHAFINKTVCFHVWDWTYFERWLNVSNTLHSPNLPMFFFFPSSGGDRSWSWACLLFNLFWTAGWWRVEPAGGVHSSYWIHLSFRLQAKKWHSWNDW